jgi:SAM-dependent methyltransferase
MMPLANFLVNPKKDVQENFFPLEVFYCKNCSLSQLSIVVNPEILFSYYTYRSSISKTFQEHCFKMSSEFLNFFSNPEETLVLDIASNDGCLLKQFKKIGFRVVGVEPAKNLAKIAENDGIPTIADFWSEKTVKELINGFGKPKIITATNVLAHVDNLNQFIKNVFNALDDDGIFIVEVPYMLNLVKKNEFDTVYHEHLSYFLVKPLLKAFELNGLKVFNIKEFPIHGGTIRVFSTKKSNNNISVNKKAINYFLELEEKNKLYDINTYKEFGLKLLELKIEFLSLLLKLKKENKKIAGFGASAKGNTLLNYCGVGSDLIEFIVDETPEKQNMLYSGNRIPIYDFKALEEKKPDFLVILAWNFAREIMLKTKNHALRGGKYIIPIPRVRIVSNVDEL